LLKYTFDNTDSQFFKSLKKEVNNYFFSSGVHPEGNSKLYLKGLLQVATATLLYVVLVFFTPLPFIALALCVILGINMAIIGFNVMHEGGHQSFSRHTWVNVISAYFLNVLGGITHYWKIKHNINHHTYTNIEGMDSDIDVKPFMRLHEDQPRRAYHRFQHLYWVILYGISYLAWIFYEDFQKYFSGRISANMDKKTLTFKEHAIFWFTKATYVFVYMILPATIVGWLSWLIGFIVVTFICGLTISLVFQLAHVVGGTHFHHVSEAKGKQEWAVHQIDATANFATSSKFLYWMLGGLNFQIEHHLFPRISHIHYPAISVMVKRACQRSSIVYNEYSSMLRAIGAHILHLRRLGRA